MRGTWEEGRFFHCMPCMYFLKVRQRKGVENRSSIVDTEFPFKRQTQGSEESNRKNYLEKRLGGLNIFSERQWERNEYRRALNSKLASYQRPSLIF